MTKPIAFVAAAFMMLSLGVVVGRADACGAPPAMLPLSFDQPIQVDAVRAGGEPSIQPLSDGTLIYSSHAGTTHLRAAGMPDADFVTPYTNTDYVWRSTDGGDTWTYVGLGGTEHGPHALTGFSDPTTAVDTAGNVYIAGITLANVYVAKSSDGGRTWFGNPFATVMTDREWLAADTENLVYLNGNSLLRGRRLWRSTDGGLTWDLGSDLPGSGSPSPLAVDQTDGRLYFPTGAFSNTVAVYPNIRSGDRTVFHGTIPGGLSAAHGFVNAIALDDAGNVYVVSNTARTVKVHHSTDRGVTWATTTISSPNREVLWPWVAAGADGRVGVSWLQADRPLSSSAQSANWSVMAAQSVTAHGWRDACGVARAPVWQVAPATAAPIHVGSICEGGLGCQLSLGSDRRLGDYHTNAITPDGTFVIATGETRSKPGSAISRPAFIRQAGGVDFRP